MEFKRLSEIDFFNLADKIENCFFVEIGANDGIQCDPLRNLIVKNNWGGILVEPNPDTFERLLYNYKDHNNLIFEKCVISEKNDIIDLYYNAKVTDLHTSLSFTYANTHFPQNLTIVPTISMTAKSLLEKHNIEKVDLLMIDVEGYDFIVLKTFPFDKYRPYIVRVEVMHIYNENSTEEEVINYLSSFDYECYLDDDNADIIGILKNK